MYTYDEESIRKEIIFYLSEGLDLYIKAAENSSIDTFANDKDIEALRNIINTLYKMESAETDCEEESKDN